MISIRNPKVERFARESAGSEGKCMTQTILEALKHLKAELDSEAERKKALLRTIASDCAAAPDLDTREPNEILGYDDVVTDLTPWEM